MPSQHGTTDLAVGLSDMNPAVNGTRKSNTMEPTKKKSLDQRSVVKVPGDAGGLRYVCSNEVDVMARNE